MQATKQSLEQSNKQYFHVNTQVLHGAFNRLCHEFNIASEQTIAHCRYCHTSIEW